MTKDEAPRASISGGPSVVCYWRGAMKRDVPHRDGGLRLLFLGPSLSDMPKPDVLVVLSGIRRLQLNSRSKRVAG